MNKLWLEDELPDGSYEQHQERGEAWSSGGGDATYPNIRNPIGFMRRKPTVRVKAWTRPIPPAFKP
jgi:hypothetical protein